MHISKKGDIPDVRFPDRELRLNVSQLHTKADMALSAMRRVEGRRLVRRYMAVWIGGIDAGSLAGTQKAATPDK